METAKTCSKPPTRLRVIRDGGGCTLCPERWFAGVAGPATDQALAAATLKSWRG